MHPAPGVKQGLHGGDTENFKGLDDCVPAVSLKPKAQQRRKHNSRWVINGGNTRVYVPEQQIQRVAYPAQQPEWWAAITAN